MSTRSNVKWLRRVAIIAFVAANLANWTTVFFEVDAWMIFFIISSALVLIGLFCEERRRRMLAEQHLNKRYRTGIRVVNGCGSVYGGWGE